MTDAGPGSHGPGDHALSVHCHPLAEGWSCTVIIGEDPRATRHEVHLAASLLADLAPDEPEELVTASFRFLLQREPRESILRRFDLAVIERYFPGWADGMRARFVRPGGSRPR